MSGITPSRNNTVTNQDQPASSAVSSAADPEMRIVKRPKPLHEELFQRYGLLNIEIPRNRLQDQTLDFLFPAINTSRRSLQHSTVSTPNLSITVTSFIIASSLGYTASFVILSLLKHVAVFSSRHVLITSLLFHASRISALRDKNKQERTAVVITILDVLKTTTPKNPLAIIDLIKEVFQKLDNAMPQWALHFTNPHHNILRLLLATGKKATVKSVFMIIMSLARLSPPQACTVNNIFTKRSEARTRPLEEFIALLGSSWNFTHTLVLQKLLDKFPLGSTEDLIAFVRPNNSSRSDIRRRLLSFLKEAYQDMQKLAETKRLEEQTKQEADKIIASHPKLNSNICRPILVHALTKKESIPDIITLLSQLSYRQLDVLERILGKRPTLLEEKGSLKALIPLLDSVKSWEHIPHVCALQALLDTPAYTTDPIEKILAFVQTLTCDHPDETTKKMYAEFRTRSSESESTASASAPTSPAP